VRARDLSYILRGRLLYVLVKDTLAMVMVGVGVHQEMIVLHNKVVIHEIETVVRLVHRQVGGTKIGYVHRVAAHKSVLLRPRYRGVFLVVLLTQILQWAQLPLILLFLFDLILRIEMGMDLLVGGFSVVIYTFLLLPDNLWLVLPGTDLPTALLRLRVFHLQRHRDFAVGQVPSLHMEAIQVGDCETADSLLCFV
jgi:hypothetical protein